MRAQLDKCADTYIIIDLYILIYFHLYTEFNVMLPPPFFVYTICINIGKLFKCNPGYAHGPIFVYKLYTTYIVHVNVA